MRLILLLIISIIGWFFGYKTRLVRMLEDKNTWKIFLIPFLFLLVLCLFGTMFHNNKEAKQEKEIETDQDVVKKVEQTVSDEYGIEVELGDQISYQEVPERYAIQKVYLSNIHYGDQGGRWYIVHQKGTSPTTEFLCYQSTYGPILDSYPYAKMVELAETCGLDSYLQSNIDDVKINRRDVIYYGPVFALSKVKKHSKDFMAKWKTYVQKLREKELVWYQRDYVYILYYHEKTNSIMEYQITHKKNKDSDKREMKNLKSWIS
ncbi:MAG: hypothetical protein J1E62_11330 [Lachnospiraceae bacterium]|nr:hypothetical protein [Lachnospiraceae bacterium]